MSRPTRTLTLLQCMEVSGSLLAVIGAAPGSSSFELGQRWLGQVSLMLDDPLTGGEDQCISCIMEIIRTERGLEVLKPLWPKVVIGLGARIASTNDVARAGAINALTQWISSAPAHVSFYDFALKLADQLLLFMLVGAASSREQDLLVPALDQQMVRLIDCAMKPLVGQRIIIYKLFALMASRDFGIRVLQVRHAAPLKLCPFLKRLSSAAPIFPRGCWRGQTSSHWRRCR